MWELRIKRTAVQRAANGRARTVGRYTIWRDGEQVKGKLYSGMTAECKGPGDNSKKGSEFDLRIQAGTYPLATQAGSKYVTIGYSSGKQYPKPGVEVLGTGYRSEILVHPGIGFLASVGCINLCTSLPNAEERIDFNGSRNRVIALIEDLKSYMDDDWPGRNGRELPGAIIVIEGEP